jgi:hypothetical protein
MSSGAWVLGLGLALALGAVGARAQEVLRKQYDDGSIYEGTFKDGRQDGTGTYKLPNGFEYTGDWVAGEIVGTGKATYPNGSFYVGQFAKGKPDGIGKMTFSDGSTYDGTWIDGAMTGQGQSTYASGASYTGGFVAGKHDGQGVMIDPDGTVYDGAWLDGVRGPRQDDLCRWHAVPRQFQSRRARWHGQIVDARRCGL